ncbi:hypothetical protein Fot_36941 [Forsythia ovata]|uniref:Uncharacterized protein n=1 Tax=Forsythia ovata TaxID=205694 RepID=A0ABD1STN8_9LAMI
MRVLTLPHSAFENPLDPMAKPCRGHPVSLSRSGSYSSRYRLRSISRTRSCYYSGSGSGSDFRSRSCSHPRSISSSSSPSRNASSRSGSPPHRRKRFILFSTVAFYLYYSYF